MKARISSTLLFLFVYAFLFLVIEVKAFADNEIKVGWIGPLTGNSAALGVDSIEVARQIFAEVNSAGGIKGRKVNLVVEDDQYETAKTVSSYNRLVHAEHVKVIFVLTYGGMLAISPLAERDDVILIDPLDCDEELAALPKNSFCVAKRTEDLGINNALHAIKHNNLPAAIIYFDGDPFPVKVAQATKDTLEKQGAKISLFEGANSGTKDFRSLLLRVKTSNAKALFVYGYDDFGLALSQARQQGISAIFYSVPGAGIGTDGFNKMAGDAVNGTFAGGWFAPRTDAYAKFRSDYKARIGREPILEVSTIPTYDMSKVLVDGLAKTHDSKTDVVNVAALREYLYGIKNYKGLSGTITIDADGAVRTLHVGMYSFDHGNFKNED